MPSELTIAIVVPVYNEESVVELFHAQLRAAMDALPYRFRVYYVNDGSTDGTAQALQRITAVDERVEVIEFSRNFGHQAALTAGLDLAEGDYVISMDGDGQHPPEKIAEMLTLAQSGYEIVLCQRMEKKGAGFFKRLTSRWFYGIINKMGDTNLQPGVADFRLLARPVVDSLQQMGEYHRFLRGMVAWVGYRTVILPYLQPERLAGKSKYTLRKMLRLAGNAIFSFSLAPLYIGITLGVIFLILAVVEAIYVLSFWVSGNQASLAPGWSSLMFVLLAVGGTLMIALGFIGVYVGYIFQEIKRRPVYIVKKKEKDV
jgi:glycosyltransferase involved in cell wall biosynthesis